MRTVVIQVDASRPDPGAIARAAECLRRGGLVAFPTETVYGLGAHALDRHAVTRLFEAKGRPASDPLIVHVAALSDVAPLTRSVSTVARMLALRFWPGPLTLIFPRAPAVPPEVTAGLETVAIRVPAHPVARALLDAARVPIAAPSANLFSRPSPTRGAHVLEDLNDRIDIVLDAGPTDVGVESTVLDLTQDPPVVLRPGAVTLEQLHAVLPSVVVRTQSATERTPASSPGMLPRHYAPRTPMRLYEGNVAAVRAAVLTAAREALAGEQRVGVLVTEEQRSWFGDLPVILGELGSERDAGQVAARFYEALRRLDAAQLDVILAPALPGDEGLWLALRDRLHRAAAHVIRAS